MLGFSYFYCKWRTFWSLTVCKNTLRCFILCPLCSLIFSFVPCLPHVIYYFCPALSLPSCSDIHGTSANCCLSLITYPPLQFIQMLFLCYLTSTVLSCLTVGPQTLLTNCFFLFFYFCSFFRLFFFCSIQAALQVSSVTLPFSLSVPPWLNRYCTLPSAAHVIYILVHHKNKLETYRVFPLLHVLVPFAVCVYKPTNLHSLIKLKLFWYLLHITLYFPNCTHFTCFGLGMWNWITWGYLSSIRS